MDNASSDATTKRFTCNLQKMNSPAGKIKPQGWEGKRKKRKGRKMPPYARRAGQLPKRVWSMRMTAFCLAMT